MVLVIVFIALCAVLNRAGGKFDKRWRRIGLPLLIMLYGLLKHRWWSVLSLPLGFGVFCLPITLVGDDIKAHWYNWVWVFVLGCLIGLIPIYSGLLAIGYGLIFFLLVFFSNLKKTADIFRWDRVELIYGSLLAIFTIILFPVK